MKSILWFLVTFFVTFTSASNLRSKIIDIPDAPDISEFNISIPDIPDIPDIPQFNITIPDIPNNPDVEQLNNSISVPTINITIPEVPINITIFYCWHPRGYKEMITCNKTDLY